MRAMQRLSPVAAILLAVAACHDGTGPGTPSPSAISGTVTSGDRQSAPAGDSLPARVEVRVTDAGGTPVPGVVLEWQVLTERGGDFRFPVTRTDSQGRSGNAWVLGGRAGEHRAEVAARIGERREVLDTVVAVARPGGVARLEVVGDTTRSLLLDDTLRVSLRGADRFGNEVPAAQLGARWTSETPDVVGVDSTGLVRTLGLGTGVVSGTTPGGSVRVRVAVDGRVEVFSARAGPAISPQHITFAQDGGRTVAVAEEYRSGVGWVIVAYEFAGGQWTFRDIASSVGGWFFTSAHVTPGGTAYAAVGSGLYVSRSAASWTPVLGLLSGAVQVAGVANTLFVLAPRSPSSSRDDSLTVYRVTGTDTVDLRLPESAVTSRSFASIAAAAENEVYVTLRGGRVIYWNGTTWRAVSDSAGDFTTGVVRLASSPAGGPVYTTGAESHATYDTRVFRLAAGRAESVPNPFAERRQATAQLAVSRDGRPHLLTEGAVAFPSASGWKRYGLRGDWTARAVWADAAPGVVWIAAMRTLPAATQGTTNQELAFLRLRTTAR